MASSLYDVSLQSPFNMIVSGPSGSGKSVFVANLLRSNIISCKPKTILWCYGVWQKEYENMPYSFHKGLPESEHIEQGDAIMIIDDLMDETSELVSKIFTKYGHHRNISCIFITQNLFPKNKHCRNLSLNAHYLVLMKNVRDRSQISCLARQVYPGKSRLLLEVFERATKQPYSYLMIDFTNKCDEGMRLKNDLFSKDGVTVYFTS